MAKQIPPTEATNGTSMTNAATSTSTSSSSSSTLYEMATWRMYFRLMRYRESQLQRHKNTSNKKQSNSHSPRMTMKTTTTTTTTTAGLLVSKVENKQHALSQSYSSSSSSFAAAVAVKGGTIMNNTTRNCWQSGGACKDDHEQRFNQDTTDLTLYNTKENDWTLGTTATNNFNDNTVQLPKQNHAYSQATSPAVTIKQEHEDIRTKSSNDHPAAVIDPASSFLHVKTAIISSHSIDVDSSKSNQLFICGRRDNANVGDHCQTSTATSSLNQHQRHLHKDIGVVVNCNSSNNHYTHQDFNDDGADREGAHKDSFHRQLHAATSTTAVTTDACHNDCHHCHDYDREHDNTSYDDAAIVVFDLDL